MNEIGERLVGKVIKKFKLAKDGSKVAITFDKNKKLKLIPHGNCCSYTWIESMDGEEALIGGTVLSVEDIPMPNLGDIDGKRHKRVDHVFYYGLKIITDKGYCVIDYRNDSRDYYGGWLGVEG